MENLTKEERAEKVLAAERELLREHMGLPRKPVALHRSSKECNWALYRERSWWRLLQAAHLLENNIPRELSARIGTGFEPVEADSEA